MGPQKQQQKVTIKGIPIEETSQALMIGMEQPPKKKNGLQFCSGFMI